jgi:hypothetical protein
MALKIGQKSLTKKNTRTVTFYRGDERFDLTVGPMPAKYLERVRDTVLKRPEPPRKAVEVKPGRFLREGNEVVFETDEKDPVYQAEFSKFVNLIIAARVDAFLAHDPNITFEAKRPDKGLSEVPEEWKAYFEALMLELLDSDTGFTSSEIGHILEEGDKTELCLDIEGSLKTF